MKEDKEMKEDEGRQSDAQAPRHESVRRLYYGPVMPERFKSPIIRSLMTTLHFTRNQSSASRWLVNAYSPIGQIVIGPSLKRQAKSSANIALISACAMQTLDF